MRHFLQLASVSLLVACGSHPAEAPVSTTPTSTPTSTTTPAATPTSTPTASSPLAHTPLVRIGDVAGPPHFDVASTLNDLVLPQLASCYAAALAAAPGLHGKMLVTFEVSEQGVVTSATETKSTTQNAPLFACIKAALVATAFPKPGGTATVNLPLVFRP